MNKLPKLEQWCMNKVSKSVTSLRHYSLSKVSDIIDNALNDAYDTAMIKGDIWGKIYASRLAKITGVYIPADLTREQAKHRKKTRDKLKGG